MNDFALDGGELNGQPEVWLITESPAAVSLSLSGGVNKARSVEALASVNLAPSFNASIRIGLKSAAGGDITLSAWMPPSVRKCLSSSAAKRVEFSGAALRRAKIGGLSVFDVDTSGGALRQAKIGGLSGFDVELSGAALLQAKIGGLSGFDVELSGGALRRAMLGGLSGFDVELSGDVLRRAMLGGLSGFDVDMSGGVNMFVATRGLSQLQVSAQTQAVVSHSRQLDGRQARVYLSGQSFERVTQATMLESLVQQWLHSLGSLQRDSYSSAGTAIIQISGTGELRDGAKINLEGEASVFVEVYSRGVLGGIRYRYLSAEAVMQILSAWNPVGHPVQPDVYTPAQEERLLFVDRDDRVISVPSEVA